MTKVLSLAYYLPQFHEIEENNDWWGAGFTEWTNLRTARQYFPEHAIRKPVGPYGEYNLLNPAVLEWQRNVARDHGIDGFMVFDYWFGADRTLLEKPMQMVLEQNLNFPYCFCWANHSWYNKRENILLCEQKYLGAEDYSRYFYRLLPHFRSGNYLKIANRPIFAVFNPGEIPDIGIFVEVFRSLALKAGFDGLYMIAENTDRSSKHAPFFDRYAKAAKYFKSRRSNNFISYLREKLTRKLNYQHLGPFVYDYAKMMCRRSPDKDSRSVPTVFTGWDTSPRHQRRGTILKNFNRLTFAQHLATIKDELAVSSDQQKIILIKSWNEWAEGNLLEPDNIFGYDLLQEYRKFLTTL